MDEDRQFFMEFVELVHAVFQKPCRDLNEFRHIVLLLYPKYLAPVLAGKGMTVYVKLILLGTRINKRGH